MTERSFKTRAERRAIAERGKHAESEVTKILNHLNNKHLTFAFERLPDARAAGGRLKAVLCDFLCWWKVGGDRFSIQLEVKQVKHDYRLSSDKLDQLPRLRKIALAGGFGVVLVYHSEIDKWRITTIDFFDGPIPPSWSLLPLPLYDSAALAIHSLSCFPRVDI